MNVNAPTIKFVEDLVPLLADYVGALPVYFYDKQYPPESSDWERSFLSNMLTYLRREAPLSTQQSVTILKLARKYLGDIARSAPGGMRPIQGLLDAPVHRIQPYPSADVKREVRYFGDGKLAFRFKYSPIVRRRLYDCFCENGDGHDCIEHHPPERIWLVQVTKSALNGLQRLIAEEQFDFDDEVCEFLAQCENSKGGVSATASDEHTLAIQVIDNRLLDWAIEHVLGGESV